MIDFRQPLRVYDYLVNGDYGRILGYHSDPVDRKMLFIVLCSLTCLLELMDQVTTHT